MSWTLTMNSEGGSKGLFVFLSTAWAVRVYWALSSRSSVLVAWMFPDLSSITKIIPAPSPERMYLMFPSPESISEWSYKKRNRHTISWMCLWNKEMQEIAIISVFNNSGFHQAIIHTQGHAVTTCTLHPGHCQPRCASCHMQGAENPTYQI